VLLKCGETAGGPVSGEGKGGTLSAFGSFHSQGVPPSCWMVYLCLFHGESENQRMTTGVPPWLRKPPFIIWDEMESMFLNPGWFMALAYWLYHFSLTRGFVLLRFSSIWRNQSLFLIFHEFMAKTWIFHRAFFGFSKDSKALPSLRIPRSWSSWQLQSRSLVRCDARRCSAVRGPGARRSRLGLSGGEFG